MTNKNINWIMKNRMCAGFEQGASVWEARTNPRSYTLAADFVWYGKFVGLFFPIKFFFPLSGPPNKKLTSLIITYFEMRPLLQSLYFASSSSLTDSLSIWSFRRFSVASSIAMSTIHPFTLFDVNFTVFMASASVNFPIKINSLNKPSRQTPFCSQRRS